MPTLFRSLAPETAPNTPPSPPTPRVGGWCFLSQACHSGRPVGIGIPSVRWRNCVFEILLTRIVAVIQVFKTQRADRRDLGDVLAGLCPMEMRRVAGQYDDAAGRIRLHPVAVKL